MMNDDNNNSSENKGMEGQTQQLDIDPSKLDDYHCEECDNDSFVSAFFAKRISKFMSKSGKPGIVPYMETIACSKCGHVNQELKPS